MAKKCSHCGCSIDDNEKIFCPNCGEFIDRELNLINKLDKTLDNYDKYPPNTEKPKQTQSKQTIPVNRHDNDDEEVTKLSTSSSTGISPILIVIVLIVIVMIAVILKIVLF